MSRKSRTQAMKAIFGSAMLLALPLATGCQSANFGGNVPGYGWVSGWWGGDAAKNDPNKPPAGFKPSERADPNGNSYVGGGARGQRGPGGAGDYKGYGAEGAKGAQGNSYAAGDRGNLNNWGGANRQTGGVSSKNAGNNAANAEGEGEYTGAPAKTGYGAAGRGERPAAGYDPYAGSSPTTGDEAYPENPRGNAYSADSRNAASGRGPTGGYGTRMASSNQRATKTYEEDDSAYDAEPAADTYGKRSATTGSGRTATVSDEGEGAMTADDEADTSSYPQTKGYGSTYRVPNRGASTPSTERRYPATKTSKPQDDGYGMAPESDGVPSEEAPVQQVAAVEKGRFSLSTKAVDMLKPSGDEEFRPGSTSRPGYRKTSSVSQAGYESESEVESTSSRRSTSRYAE